MCPAFAGLGRWVTSLPCCGARHLISEAYSTETDSRYQPRIRAPVPGSGGNSLAFASGLGPAALVTFAVPPVRGAAHPPPRSHTTPHSAQPFRGEVVRSSSGARRAPGPSPCSSERMRAGRLAPRVASAGARRQRCQEPRERRHGATPITDTLRMRTRSPRCSVTAGRVVGRFLFSLGHCWGWGGALRGGGRGVVGRSSWMCSPRVRGDEAIGPAAARSAGPTRRVSGATWPLKAVFLRCA